MPNSSQTLLWARSGGSGEGRQVRKGAKMSHRQLRAFGECFLSKLPPSACSFNPHAGRWAGLEGVHPGFRWQNGGSGEAAVAKLGLKPAPEPASPLPTCLGSKQRASALKSSLHPDAPFPWVLILKGRNPGASAHASLQQAFPEHGLDARHCAECWGHTGQ